MSRFMRLLLWHFAPAESRKADEAAFLWCTTQSNPHALPHYRTTQPPNHPLDAAVFRTLAIIAATAAEATRKLLQCN